MPEYLTPAVYVEETSFRSKPIEGVPTSTFGMAGRTQYGPVPYKLDTPKVTMTPKPQLVTSYTEYERLYGGLSTVSAAPETVYLAHAARSFFENGGRRLYVSRVFPFVRTAAGAIDVDPNFASLAVGNPAVAIWRARWPGEAGKQISVKVEFVRSKNVLVTTPAGLVLKGVLPGAAVELGDDPAKPPTDKTPPVKANIHIIGKRADGTLGFKNAAGTAVDPIPAATKAAFHITLNVTVRFGSDRADVYAGLELDTPHSVAITKVLQAEDPSDDTGVVWLDASTSTTPAQRADLLDALVAETDFAFLANGGNDSAPGADDLKGEESDPDDVTIAATGLTALGEIDDIAIVACPDTAQLDKAAQPQAVQYLLDHCELLKYRIAIVDPPNESSISEVRDFRSKFDSKYGALYYPWIQVLDPSVKNDPGAPPALLDLPPSGFTAGIYARSDIERGVHKAPANEVVRGMTKLKFNVTYDRQSVLNPEGINALRFFEGRSNRVWGARTMSSDPEWKYVNVRRLFIYLEHSIDKATQWAVFEPNNERLWASITQSVKDFLLVTWRTGALMGTKPEEAYFVRCDRTTMTQNDLDNGRLICLIGVAPTYPAEFVIFRIGQWTADAKQS
jgi:phage tail sheath protein FI